MTPINSPPNPEALFEGSDSGRILTHRQIGYIGLKTATSVKWTDDGIIVDGEQFTPLDDEP